ANGLNAAIWASHGGYSVTGANNPPSRKISFCMISHAASDRRTQNGERPASATSTTWTVPPSVASTTTSGQTVPGGADRPYSTKGTTPPSPSTPNRIAIAPSVSLILANR